MTCVKEILEENISRDILFTISEVASILKVNKNYVYKLIDKGCLRSIKLGCRKVTRKSLMEFLDEFDGKDFEDII